MTSFFQSVGRLKAVSQAFAAGLCLVASAAWAGDTSVTLSSLETASTIPLASHRVLSCNIRVALPADEANGVGWPQRKAVCAQVIKEQHADIVCLQEVLRPQIEDLEATLSQYQVFGFAGPEMDSTDPGYKGIAKNPILFLRERYTLQAAGTYWLSETPLIGGSQAWGTARPRHVNWVRLKDKSTGRDFRVMNIHLDHVSQDARQHQIGLAIQESGQFPSEYPQIFTGDFNANARNPVYKMLLDAGWKDSWTMVRGEEDAGFTTHNFHGQSGNPDKPAKPYPKIDFIFVKGPVKPTATKVLRDSINGQYPSDHYFLSADVTM